MLMSPIEADRLRADFLSAMSRAANTVYVVTTDGPAGRAGVTVTALSSVSADVTAPRLLICLHHESSTAQVIRANGAFCVNMLGEGQSDLADRFAGKLGADIDRFAKGDWGQAASGLPRLMDAAACFDCRLSEETLVGTHHVIFGAVQEAHAREDVAPLMYFDRAYGAVQRG